MAPTQRIQIFHRSRLFRECVAAALSEHGSLEVLDPIPSDSDHAQHIDQQRPDLILIDLDLPDRFAVALTEHILKPGGNTKVIVLSSSGAQETLFECMAAGAHGCVLEAASVADLQAAIQRVLGGEMYYSPGVVEAVFHRLAETGRPVSWRQRVQTAGLTSRELEIVHCIAQNLSNKQIAKRLSISLHTVKNHVHNIVEKLHVANRFEAVEYARRQHWLKRP